MTFLDLILRIVFLLFVQKVTKAFKGQKLAINSIHLFTVFIPLRQFVP